RRPAGPVGSTPGAGPTARPTAASMNNAKEQPQDAAAAPDAREDRTAGVSPAGAGGTAALPTEAPQSLAPPRSRGTAIALAGALLLVVLLVGTAPFWAASLPWAPVPSAPPPDPRIDQVEAAQHSAHQDAAALKTALQRLDQRLGV